MTQTFITKTISTQAFTNQKPGTSGIRKKTKVFKETPHYLENYIQSLINALKLSVKEKSQPVIIGGDGRFFNDTAIQKTIAILLANGFSNLLIAQKGLISTPAISHLIKKNHAIFGLNFSASHNPAGINGDTGIKLNLADGAPAPSFITEKIYQATQIITQYFIADIKPINLDTCQQLSFDLQHITVFNSIVDYVNLMKYLFDFTKIKSYLNTHKFCFDAMNAVTGPYAKSLFCDELGVKSSDILNAIPLNDFGGIHPDPNPKSAKELYQKAMNTDCEYVLLAASDADGDRNMILGRHISIHPCDSLAIMLDYHKYLPIKEAIKGVARSFVSSRSVDKVAKKHHLSCYQVPTGWKFFNNLIDSQRIALCGEESFGTSGNHVREKDGIWSVLCWLTILANTRKSVLELINNHWEIYGRYYYARYDFESLDNKNVDQLLSNLTYQLSGIPKFNQQQATQVHQFSYTDPVTQEISNNHGYEVFFSDNARFTLRVSGTGTSGVTLRIYTEVFSNNAQLNIQEVLNPLIALATKTINLKKYCHIDKPSGMI